MFGTRSQFLHKFQCNDLSFARSFLLETISVELALEVGKITRATLIDFCWRECDLSSTCIEYRQNWIGYIYNDCLLNSMYSTLNRPITSLCRSNQPIPIFHRNRADVCFFNRSKTSCSKSKKKARFISSFFAKAQNMSFLTFFGTTSQIKPYGWVHRFLFGLQCARGSFCWILMCVRSSVQIKTELLNSFSKYQTTILKYL